jgi:hypothetical protein
MDYKTEFFDKFGKQIFIGDTLQTRLGKFGKSGGSTRQQVLRKDNHIKLVNESDAERKYGGYDLTQQIANYSVIVEKEILR